MKSLPNNSQTVQRPRNALALLAFAGSCVAQQLLTTLLTLESRVLNLDETLVLRIAETQIWHLSETLVLHIDLAPG